MAEKKKFKKPYRQLGAPPNPDDGWDVPDVTTDELIGQCDRIKLKIREAPQSVWARAHEFFADVERKVGEVAETVRDEGRATQGQKKALTAWEGGVDKWLKKKGQS